MDHENTQNRYDDGNIPDSDLPERSGSGQSQQGYRSDGQARYPYSPEDYDGIDPELAHDEPDLVWVTPPVLLSEAPGVDSTAPGMV